MSVLSGSEEVVSVGGHDCVGGAGWGLAQLLQGLPLRIVIARVNVEKGELTARGLDEGTDLSISVDHKVVEGDHWPYRS
jgi:CxxC motif-containing protein